MVVEILKKAAGGSSVFVQSSGSLYDIGIKVNLAPNVITELEYLLGTQNIKVK